MISVPYYSLTYIRRQSPILFTVCQTPYNSPPPQPTLIQNRSKSRDISSTRWFARLITYNVLHDFSPTTKYFLRLFFIRWCHRWDQIGILNISKKTLFILVAQPSLQYGRQDVLATLPPVCHHKRTRMFVPKLTQNLLFSPLRTFLETFPSTSSISLEPLTSLLSISIPVPSATSIRVRASQIPISPSRSVLIPVSVDDAWQVVESSNKLFHRVRVCV